MIQPNVFAVTVVVGGFLALVLLVWSLKLRSRCRKSNRRIEDLEEELNRVHRTSAQEKREHHFFSAFLREFPHLTRGLHSEVKARDIPEILNRIVARSFEPWQSLVVRRRQKASTDPGRETRLVIAATAPPDSEIVQGKEFVFGEGELGYVAESQQLMSRADFERLEPATRARLKKGSLTGFRADLVAPMCFHDQTLGLLALSHPSVVSESSKAALRVVAHIGALALHNANAYSEMKLSAELDGLTRIYNKTYISAALSEHICEAEKKGTVVSVLLMDLDNFKNYNDTNGHDAGDNLLRQFAALVGDNVRNTDVLGRFGGEEFLLIFAGTNKDGALIAAEKVLKKIASFDFAYAERQPLGFVSISGGVAEYPQDARDSAELLRAADKALYEAKQGGRNRVLGAKTQYIGGDTEVVADRSVLEAALERELSPGE